MSRIALVLLPVLVLGQGCFYTDPINQRPSIDIHQTSSTEVYRRDQVTLEAVASDPEGQPVFFQWRAYACTDATAAGDGSRPGCDTAPFRTELQPTFAFSVPALRDDQVTPVQAVIVLLEGKDDLGATARPIQQLILPIADHAPVLELRKDSGHGFVVNTPVALYAKVGDPDDDPEVLARSLDWQVFSPPSQPAFDFVELAVVQDPMDPAHRQRGKLFTPHAAGDFDLQVTATDPLGVTDVEHLPITVVPDHAPCLGQLAPLAPPTGQTYPLADPTLFQVLVVDDDLDVYPPVPSDPVLGVPTFSWSLLPAGATTRQPIAGATSNHVALDPASFTPGDIVELRVEIQDRNQTPITCADSSPTCSVISQASCIQRQTWRVEVR